MELKKARIIYNPTSGREVFKRSLPDVLITLERAGYETSAHATTGPGDAVRAARIAAERGVDLVIAAGGDGTINEVVNGLAEQPHRPKLGIIPVGTTNDFARAISVPRSIKAASEIIAEGHTIPLDIGRVNDRYFINIAGGGRLTELTYDVPSKLKTMLGQMAYYLKGIEMLPSLKATPVRLEYDGEVFEGNVMLFLISNTNSVGGFEKLAPRASINDGLFDMIILKETNLAEFVRLASLALLGDHLNNDKLMYIQAKEIKVTSENNIMINVDGEYGGDAPAEFLNLHQHLQLVVPRAVAERVPGTTRIVSENVEE